MNTSANARQEPKKTLQNMEVHSAWTRQFRTTENDAFYDLAFDYIASAFGTPDESPVLDAGCGSAVKTLHLARRGYRVRALDFSDVILEEARMATASANLSDRITFDQGDLTALTLETGSVRRALCWGVLMHVPDVEKAVSELARVVAPGGRLVVSEGNFRSIQSVALRWLKRILGRERAKIVHSPAGIEVWEETSNGKLMTRQADIPWLIAEFSSHGMQLVQRSAGQFTEVYMILQWRPLRLMIHAWNNFWFRRIRAAGLAYGNILVLERPLQEQRTQSPTGRS